jgi:hypothetical protein
MLDLYTEFRQVIDTLNREQLPYAVCGGLAYSIHVQPRATVGIDILVRSEDLERIVATLVRAGYTSHPKPMPFAEGRVVIQRLWKLQERDEDVLMLDLLVVNDEAMPGVWESREDMSWEGLWVSIVSRQGLIRLKELRGSAQDRADIEGLSTQGDK